MSVSLFVHKGCSGWLQWSEILRYETKRSRRIRIVTVSLNVCCDYFLFFCLFVCLFRTDVPGDCSRVEYCEMKRNGGERIRIVTVSVMFCSFCLSFYSSHICDAL